MFANFRRFWLAMPAYLWAVFVILAAVTPPILVDRFREGDPVAALWWVGALFGAVALEVVAQRWKRRYDREHTARRDLQKMLDNLVESKPLGAPLGITTTCGGCGRSTRLLFDGEDWMTVGWADKRSAP